MKVISNKDGDLLTQFDTINENDIPVLERLADLPPQIRSTRHQKMLINNLADANKGKFKGYLYLEVIFGFCETSKKITENLGFHLMFKTNIIYSSMAVDIIVTIINLYVYVPNLIPSVETQVMFNEASQNKYKISYDVWYTERRVISDMITEADIGSSQKVKSPLYLIGAHKTRARAETANKNINIAISDNLNLLKYYVEIDGQRYPKDSFLMNYVQNDCIEQYRDLKFFFKEYIGEPILNPSIRYPDNKTKYLIELIDLRHQIDHITPKKFQLFHEVGNDPEIAGYFLMLIKRREIELISDGINLIEVKIIYMKKKFKDFVKKKYFKK